MRLADHLAGCDYRLMRRARWQWKHQFWSRWKISRKRRD